MTGSDVRTGVLAEKTTEPNRNPKKKAAINTRLACLSRKNNRAQPEHAKPLDLFKCRVRLSRKNNRAQPEQLCAPAIRYLALVLAEKTTEPNRNCSARSFPYDSCKVLAEKTTEPNRNCCWKVMCINRERLSRKNNRAQPEQNHLRYGLIDSDSLSRKNNRAQPERHWY